MIYLYHVTIDESKKKNVYLILRLSHNNVYHKLCIANSHYFWGLSSKFKLMWRKWQKKCFKIIILNYALYQHAIYIGNEVCFVYVYNRAIAMMIKNYKHDVCGSKVYLKIWYTRKRNKMSVYIGRQKINERDVCTTFMQPLYIMYTLSNLKVKGIL